MRPLCFVLMPFGEKSDAAGGFINFDSVYEVLIKPAIESAGMQPLRADEELTGGIIHKPMFERLILCEYAIADLTTANANVFYELGLRHAVRPWSTVLLFAEGFSQLPFDIGLLRGLPYKLGPDGQPSHVEAIHPTVVQRLKDAKKAKTDSPIFQLVEDFPDVQRLKTDVFRERINYSEAAKRKLSIARNDGVSAIKAFERSLNSLADEDAAVVIDLFLSYRSVEAWREMVDLVPKMAPPLANTVMVQEQLGLALNRLKRSEEAVWVLVELIARRGPSSETYGILGRVYKDRWEEAKRAGDDLRAIGFLDQAIDAYNRGFQADWRDAYPGVNAVTLMEIKDPPDPHRFELLPVVKYAAKHRCGDDKKDYWDRAALLELAVLENDKAVARQEAIKALSLAREPFETKTTARNLRLIREAREKRGEDGQWVQAIEDKLKKESV